MQFELLKSFILDQTIKNLDTKKYSSIYLKVFSKI